MINAVDKQEEEKDAKNIMKSNGEEDKNMLITALKKREILEKQRAMEECEMKYVVGALAISPYIGGNNEIYLAMCSVESYDYQKLDIVVYTPATDLASSFSPSKFYCVASFHFPFPCTRIKWSPAQNIASEGFFLTTSDRLRLFKWNCQIATLPHYLYTPSSSSFSSAPKNAYNSSDCSFMSQPLSESSFFSIPVGNENEGDLEEITASNKFGMKKFNEPKLCENEKVSCIFSVDWSEHNANKVVTCGMDGRAVLWDLNKPFFENYGGTVMGGGFEIALLESCYVQTYPESVNKNYQCNKDVSASSFGFFRDKLNRNLVNKSYKGRVGICDVAFSCHGGGQVVAFSLVDKKIIIHDCREKPLRKQMVTSDTTHITRLSWMQKKEGLQGGDFNYLLQSDMYSGEIHMYDLRKSFFPELEYKITIGECMSPKSISNTLCASQWNPLKSKSFVVAKHCGTVEVWDSKAVHMEEQNLSRHFFLSSIYDLNEENPLNHSQRITAFALGSSNYIGHKGKECQVAALGVIEQHKMRKKNTDKSKHSDVYKHPTLQLIRMN